MLLIQRIKQQQNLLVGGMGTFVPETEPFTILGRWNYNTHTPLLSPLEDSTK